MAVTPIELLFGTVSKATIGVVTLDASLTEKHARTNEITKFPVEEGPDVGDHIRHNPPTIEIDGVISNTPIAILGSLIGATGPAVLALGSNSPVKGDNSTVSDRVHAADKAFLAAMDGKDLLTVVTSLRTYKNMVMTSYSVTRDQSNGNVLNFHIGLEELVIAQTQTITATRVLNPVNGSEENLGVQTAKSPGFDPNKSLLDQIGHAGINFLRTP